MEFKFNVTGAKRKELVQAISEILNAPAKYQGAPTFAYEIGSYHIDKTGMLTGPDNLDLEDSLHQMGFDADGDSREYDEVPDIDQHHPGRYANPDAPITSFMQRQLDEVFAEYHEDNELVIEMPKEGFTESAIANLERLVQSKAALIKKALGADQLLIEQTADRLRFPWFTGSLTGEEVNAYAHFIGALCAMAKNQQRVTATEKVYDNEKYAFRCFLLRLGFIGPEYKEQRKILLARLTGSAAFKSGQRNPEEATEA